MVPTLLTHPENKDFGWELALDLIAWVREFLRGQVGAGVDSSPKGTLGGKRQHGNRGVEVAQYL